MSFLILFTFFFVSLFASETDTFSVRQNTFIDVTKELNVEIQRRLNIALERANQSEGCDADVLYEEVGKVLKRPFIGVVESWVNHSTLPSHKVNYEHSIYRDSSFYESPGLHLTEASLGLSIMLNGEIIGTDKLGHFFDQGYALYESYLKYGTLNKGMKYSDSTEQGIYGLTMTGIESFADKVANHQGLIFWGNLIDRGYAYQKIATFRCKNNIFVWKHKFNWADYVDGAWDESINCNRYTGDMEKKVLKRINELGMSCPVGPQKCADAVKKYGDLKDHLLHPTCIKAGEKLLN